MIGRQGDHAVAQIIDEFSLAATMSQAPVAMTEEERDAVLAAGRELAADAADAWLLISGNLSPRNDETTEGALRESLLAVYGYPPEQPAERTVNLLLDSRGGSLDSAFRTVLFLSQYANRLIVHVPRRAKSASTLIALGADEIVLSPFGELGPLDTQIDDPRNPTKTVSALDCYQSVDYVRQFGTKTLTEVLDELVAKTHSRVRLSELLETASGFAIGSIAPLLQGVSALDFGGWGRSLKIGEAYARTLLLAKDSDADRASRIAERLVYGYTHHPRPINRAEADDIGLHATSMAGSLYEKAMTVVTACHERGFVGFLSAAEVEREHAHHPAGTPAVAGTRSGNGQPVPVTAQDSPAPVAGLIDTN